MKTLRTLREVFFSSLPLLLIIAVCIVIQPLGSASEYFKIAIGFISVVIGQSLFLVGLDESILPAGKLAGNSLINVGNAVIIVLFGLLFGLVATVAEPALSVLASQTGMITETVNPTIFIWALSAGTGIFVGIAFIRIMKDISIKHLFAVVYALVFVMAIFVPSEYIALAFDGSGATTGDISVPFILSLGIGIMSVMTKHKTNDSAFGVIGIASVGSIIAMFIYGIINRVIYGGIIPPAAQYDPGAVESIGIILSNNFSGVIFAVLPIIIAFIPLQIFIIKLPLKKVLMMLAAVVPVCLGLFIFLSGIDYGFAFAAKYIAEIFLAESRPVWFKWLLLPLGFILGAAITLTEPAVTVLGDQLEEITNGHIKKDAIRYTLAIGIGFASTLAMLKILTQINIMWFLLPLYAVALGLMPFTSEMFVGLAFDSGGVTGGALTSAFLTPLTLGAAQAVAAAAGANAQSVLTNGFGIIAFISVTPMIAVQTLGIIYERRLEKYRAVEKEQSDEDYIELLEYIGDDGDGYVFEDENDPPSEYLTLPADKERMKHHE